MVSLRREQLRSRKAATLVSKVSHLVRKPAVILDASNLSMYLSHRGTQSPDIVMLLAAVTQKYLIVTCNQAARRLGVTKLQGVTGMPQLA